MGARLGLSPQSTEVYIEGSAKSSPKILEAPRTQVLAFCVHSGRTLVSGASESTQFPAPGVLCRWEHDRGPAPAEHRGLRPLQPDLAHLNRQPGRAPHASGLRGPEWHPRHHGRRWVCSAKTQCENKKCQPRSSLWSLPDHRWLLCSLLVLGCPSVALPLKNVSGIGAAHGRGLAMPGAQQAPRGIHDLVAGGEVLICASSSS